MHSPHMQSIFHGWILSAVISLACFGLRPIQTVAEETKTPTAAAEPMAWMDIEQLSQIKIISASNRPENADDVPAAVRVLPSEEIARSGATSFPEALRLVPGLNVSQINGSSWGLGARGFQAQYASKLLVMMDGRSIYTPIYGGVNWDVQDYLLEDIDRIEVVMGPGGSIWGANAVNGVIHLISKSARDTLGGLVYGGGGNEKLALTGLRYGWKAGEEVYARAYVKHSVTDDTRSPQGASGNDSTQLGHAGFRLDGYPRESTHWTLSGGTYLGSFASQLDMPSLAASPGYSVIRDDATDVSGGNLLGRWENEVHSDSTLRVQAYYDYTQRAGTISQTKIHTADVTAQHTWRGWERHQIDWGVGYRLVSDENKDAFVSFTPAHLTTHLFSGFIQDELWLAPDRLALTAGLKVEHNDYTGFEPQPNVRLAWHPTERQTLWAAWSSPVRTPTRVESHGRFDPRIFPPGTMHPDLPAVFRGLGSRDLSAERLQAFELGWRWPATPQWSFDVSGFYYEYDHLIIVTQGPPQPQASPPAVVVPGPYDNGMDGYSYGGELAAAWSPNRHWRLRASYSCVRMELTPHRPDPFAFEAAESNTPRHTAALQASVQMHRDWTCDTSFRWVDEMVNNQIPRYAELDVRLRWRPRPDFEISLVGQNLLHDQHPESKPSPIGRPTEIQRSVYAKATWKF